MYSYILYLLIISYSKLTIIILYYNIICILYLKFVNFFILFQLEFSLGKVILIILIVDQTLIEDDIGSAVTKNLQANRLSNFPIPHNKRCIIRLTMASTFSDDELVGKSSTHNF